MGPAMRLNLGCGRRREEGFINVDLPGSGADIECDIRSLPVGDAEAEEVMAIHVLEHFYLHEVEDVLKEWLRVIKPGGMLVIELPCLEKVLIHIASCIMYDKPLDDRMIRWPMFGDPSTHKAGEPALHKWLHSQRELVETLQSMGCHVAIEEPHYHNKNRDMRIVASKQ